MELHAKFGALSYWKHNVHIILHGHHFHVPNETELYNDHQKYKKKKSYDI